MLAKSARLVIIAHQTQSSRLFLAREIKPPSNIHADMVLLMWWSNHNQGAFLVHDGCIQVVRRQRMSSRRLSGN